MTHRTLQILLMLICGLAVPAAGQIYLHPNNNNEDDATYRARRASIDAAQGQVDRAQAMLDVAVTRVKANWQASGEMQPAEVDLKSRQAELAAARAPVIAKLQQDPTYIAARTEALRADAEMKQAGPTTEPTTQISAAAVAAATDKLNKKSVVHDMEQQALAADPAVVKAQAQVDAAQQKVEALNVKFKAVLLNDPDYKAALDQLNTAKAQLTAAAGQ